MLEKFAAASFERFCGWLVRNLRTKWRAAAVICMDTNKPRGGHWASDLWRAQLGGTRSPEPFLSVTASNYATTQQRFILRGKTHFIHTVRDLSFPAPSDAILPATSSSAQQSKRWAACSRPLRRPLTSQIAVRVRVPEVMGTKLSRARAKTPKGR